MPKRGKYSAEAWKKAMTRFFTQHFLAANAHVIGDVIAVYRTFSEEKYVVDLCLWQIRRKLSMDGLKSAAVSFIADDPFMRQVFSGFRIF